jgi:hypothetical protein
MNPDVKKMWIKALTDGSFAQTHGCLIRVAGGPNEPDKFCCLGVLSELHARATGTIKRFKGMDGDWGYAWTADQDALFGANAMPLRETCEWAGLEPADEAFLAEQNDAGSTFNAIAGYIERHL